MHVDVFIKNDNFIKKLFAKIKIDAKEKKITRLAYQKSNMFHMRSFQD